MLGHPIGAGWLKQHAVSWNTDLYANGRRWRVRRFAAMPGSRHRGLASEAKALLAYRGNSAFGHAPPSPLPRTNPPQQHYGRWHHYGRGLELDHRIAKLWPNRRGAFGAGRAHHGILSAGALPITNASERLRSGNLVADKTAEEIWLLM